MPPGSPKNFLSHPSQFGRVAEPQLEPWEALGPRGRGLLASAFAQHHLAYEARLHLRSQHMTQATLAGAIGRTPGALSKQLNGDNWMPLQVTFAISGALDRVDWINAIRTEILPRFFPEANVWPRPE